MILTRRATIQRRVSGFIGRPKRKSGHRIPGVSRLHQIYVLLDLLWSPFILFGWQGQLGFVTIWGQIIGDVWLGTNVWGRYLWGDIIGDSFVRIVSDRSSLDVSLSWVRLLWGPKFRTIVHLLGTLQWNYCSFVGDNATEWLFTDW